MSNNENNIPDGNRVADDVNVNEQDDNVSVDNSELPITFLVKFIKTFDDNRDELSPFIADCNKAFLLATNRQKYIVMR